MNSRDPYAGLVSSRRSRFFYLDMLESEPALRAKIRSRHDHDGLYVSMLSDDVARLLPYGRGIDEGFTVTVEPGDTRIVNLVRNALPAQYWPARSLTDGLREFVEGAARRMMSGSAFYEIDYLRRPSDHPDGTPVAFRIEPIPPGTVDHVDGRPIQYVPRAASMDRNAVGLPYVRLDDQQLISIALDQGSSQAFADANRILTAADEGQGVPLSMIEAGQRANSGFDFAAFQAAKNRVLLAGTRDLGWDGRQLFTDSALAPYTVWRHLQFTKFKIRVRDTALMGLTEVLRRASVVMGLDSPVTFAVAGVVTVADVHQAESDLESGAVALSQLLQLGF